jgi:hypothetical protein
VTCGRDRPERVERGEQTADHKVDPQHASSEASTNFRWRNVVAGGGCLEQCRHARFSSCGVGHGSVEPARAVSPAHVRGADRQFLGERDIVEQVSIVSAVIQIERPRRIAGPPAVGVEAIPRHAAGQAEKHRKTHEVARPDHRIETAMATDLPPGARSQASGDAVPLGPDVDPIFNGARFQVDANPPSPRHSQSHRSRSP